jgi:hypothetical protein
MDEKFPDGDVIHRDQRFEDPLVYYLPGGTFERAIGFEFWPEYDYEKVEDVTSRLFESHDRRFQALDDQLIRTMLDRVIRTMSDRNRRWTRWSVEWPVWLATRLGEDSLRGPFIAAGWTLQSSPGSENHVWTRPKKDGLPHWSRPRGTTTSNQPQS